MPAQLVLSSSTVITLLVIFLIIMALMLMRKTIAVIMTAVVISIVVVIIVQAATGQVLVNLSELGDFAIHYLLKLYYWVMETFWPKLGEVATDIGNQIG